MSLYVFFICRVNTVFTLLRVERSWLRKTSQPSSPKKRLLSKKAIYLRVWIISFCFYAHFLSWGLFFVALSSIFTFLQLLSDGKPAQSKRLLTEEPQSDQTLKSDHQQEGNGWSNLLHLSSVCSQCVAVSLCLSYCRLCVIEPAAATAVGSEHFGPVSPAVHQSCRSTKHPVTARLRQPVSINKPRPLGGVSHCVLNVLKHEKYTVIIGFRYIQLFILRNHDINHNEWKFPLQHL